MKHIKLYESHSDDRSQGEVVEDLRRLGLISELEYHKYQSEFEPQLYDRKKIKVEFNWDWAYEQAETSEEAREFLVKQLCGLSAPPAGSFVDPDSIQVDPWSGDDFWEGEMQMNQDLRCRAQADLVFRSSMQRAILSSWIETFPKSIFKYVSLNK